MAYEKLVFCNENYVLGYQTINKAKANLEAVFTGLSAEHSNGLGTAVAFGRHDTKNVPRAVIQVYGTGSANTSSTFMAPAAQATPSYGAPTVTRISTGIYLVPISGLSSYWGEAVPNCTQTSKPVLVCRSETPTGVILIGSKTAITISCYEMSTGSLVLTDMDFTFTLYGY